MPLTAKCCRRAELGALLKTPCCGDQEAGALRPTTLLQAPQQGCCPTFFFLPLTLFVPLQQRTGEKICWQFVLSLGVGVDVRVPLFFFF